MRTKSTKLYLLLSFRPICHTRYTRVCACVCARGVLYFSLFFSTSSSSTVTFRGQRHLFFSPSPSYPDRPSSPHTVPSHGYVYSTRGNPSARKPRGPEASTVAVVAAGRRGRARVAACSPVNYAFGKSYARVHERARRNEPFGKRNSLHYFTSYKVVYDDSPGLALFLKLPALLPHAAACSVGRAVWRGCILPNDIINSIAYHRRQK